MNAMPEWLQALGWLGTERAVLITVAQTQGSTPREAGARMVVTAHGQFDTIGGGHLELQATEMARAMLAHGQPAVARLRRIALGPSLGQCCGGTVQLLFEPVEAFPPEMLAELEAAWRERRDIWRRIPIEQPAAAAVIQPLPSQAQRCTYIGHDANGQLCVFDLVHGARPQVFLFGAGHVGHALVRVLETLPCRVTWVDTREDVFPRVLPANVHAEVTDVPAATVRQATPGSYFLVMTHSHPLDLELAETILKRGDFAWFGLIGSASKRAQFERRLLDRDIGPAQLARMTCPIGIDGIRSKAPASIAISVAAQLLHLWECTAAA